MTKKDCIDILTDDYNKAIKYATNYIKSATHTKLERHTLCDMLDIMQDLSSIIDDLRSDNQ